jgi:hypothetical protein
MALFGWLSRRPKDGTEAWRNEWNVAVEALDASAVPRLEAALRTAPPLADDLEVEEEMLDALKQLLALEAALAAAGPPLIETSHRVVGHDACHFSAPVSVPDDPAQPTGRLLLTSTRAVFAGGARAPALPWHTVRQVVRHARDVLFVTTRGGEDDGVRYRCNSFGEALCAAAIARHLVERSGRARVRQL